MVEIIPKEPPKPSAELSILFYFSVFLLIFSVVGYFLLSGLIVSAEKKLEVLNSALAETMTPEKVSLEKEILASKNKIDKFSLLIKQHLEPSAVFEVIEKNTHPKVWFYSFDLNPRQGLLRLSGEAQSFEALGQQIIVLKEERVIKKVVLESCSITRERRIDFNLSLSFDAQYFLGFNF